MGRGGRLVVALTLCMTACAAAQPSTPPYASSTSSSPTPSPSTSTSSIASTALTSSQTHPDSPFASLALTSPSTTSSPPGRATSDGSSLGPPSSGTSLTKAASSAASTSPPPPPPPPPPPAAASDTKRRNLIIILSVVVGITALALVGLLIFGIRHYCSSDRSLLRRMATPIDDEEIASWRKGGFERQSEKREPWPAMSNVSPAPPPGAHTRPPNSRSGLTDSSVPGAEPFVLLPRRHSSKLQKSPSRRAPSTRSPRRSSSISGRPLTPFSPTPVTMAGVSYEKHEPELQTSSKRETHSWGSRELSRERPTFSEMRRPSSQSFDFGFSTPPSSPLYLQQQQHTFD